MPLILYSAPLSPPSRAAEAGLRLLKLNAKVQWVDLVGRKHLQEAFRSLNPQHTVPTLKDGNTVVWHAPNILQYLVDKYSPDNSLFPKNLEVRTQIQQYLYFNAGPLFTRLYRITEPVFFQGATSVAQEKLGDVHQVLEVLEDTMSHSRGKFLVGSNLTIADLCVASTVTAAYSVLEIPRGKYVLIDDWLATFRENLPESELFDRGGRGIGKFFRAELEKNQKKTGKKS